MALQYSVAVRNAQLDSIETTVGVSAIMRIRTGTVPATAATADAGSVLATLNLPSDWMTSAASGTKTINGTWTDGAADAAGVAGHFRVYDSTGVTCHLQGTVSITGGGGDLVLDNTNIAVGQVITVVSFTISAGNA